MREGAGASAAGLASRASLRAAAALVAGSSRWRTTPCGSGEADAAVGGEEAGGGGTAGGAAKGSVMGDAADKGAEKGDAKNAAGAAEGAAEAALRGADGGAIPERDGGGGDGAADL